MPHTDNFINVIYEEYYNDYTKYLNNFLYISRNMPGHINDGGYNFIIKWLSRTKELTHSKIDIKYNQSK